VLAYLLIHHRGNAQTAEATRLLRGQPIDPRGNDQTKDIKIHLLTNTRRHSTRL